MPGIAIFHAATSVETKPSVPTPALPPFRDRGQSEERRPIAYSSHAAWRYQTRRGQGAATQRGTVDIPLANPVAVSRPAALERPSILQSLRVPLVLSRAPLCPHVYILRRESLNLPPPPPWDVTDSLCVPRNAIWRTRGCRQTCRLGKYIRPPDPTALYIPQFV